MEEKGARHGAGSQLGRGGGGSASPGSPPPPLRRRRRAHQHPVPPLDGLWTRLPDLIFRDVALGSLEVALASLQAAVVGPGPVGVPLLDICVPALPIGSLLEIGEVQFSARVSVLLHAAARLSPVELRFAVRRVFPPRSCVELNVPRFHRATSIELHGLDLVSADPHDSFPALERLTLFGCRVKLADFCCPHLRVLRMANGPDQMSIIAQSASLQEMDVEGNTIDIDAPALKQLTLSFTPCCGIRVRVSILAPLLEKVSWWCMYTMVTAGLGLWGLLAVRLQTEENNGISSGEGAHLHHVLTLFVSAHISHSFRDADLSFAAEIEKHLVTDFSVLELHLITMGHVFGTFVLRLLGMHRISAATRSLKIVLRRSEAKQACPASCHCDEPKNWRSQSISLTNLENVEIKGFQGEDHEFDFLKLIFRCATMLKVMTVRLSDEVTISNKWCTKMYDIFKAYPMVECNIDLSPGKQGQLTAAIVVRRHDSHRLIRGLIQKIALSHANQLH